MVQANQVFIVPQPRPKAELRLFCFPCAGGSAYSYQPWLSHFGPRVELVLVELKGRGVRINEPPHQDMQSLIDEFMLHRDVFTACPFMFFGHSMGALISYALCCELKQQGLALPVQMLVSACRAPHLPALQPQLHRLPQADFFQMLQQLNGTPAEVLANKELMELFEPVLRADFNIASTYQAQAVQMPFAFSVLYGDRDHSLRLPQLEAWQELSSQHCVMTQLPGDHFFIRQSSALVINWIEQQILDYFCNSTGL